jgi:hypothetical protein
MDEIDLGGFHLNSKEMVKQLKQDMRDDWFKDPLDYEDMLDPERVKEKLVENITKNHGIYVPSDVLVIDIPKHNYLIRYTLEKSLSDRIFYQGVCSYLMKYFDPLFSERSYSHRLELDSKVRKKRLFRNAVEQWKSFEGIVKSRCDGKVLLVTDLTNYFENIRIKDIHTVLVSGVKDLKIGGLEKIKIRRAIDVLDKCLKKWSYSETHGLPQNRDASSFLANVVMDPIDKIMLSKGYDYHRYMDDIKIVCDDVFQARKALMELIQELRKYGLSVNSKKTNICEKEEDINKEFSSSNRKIEQIDALWKSKRKEAVVRSIKSLVTYAKELVESGGTQDRAFRFCIKRLEMLCLCEDISIDSSQLDDFTTCVIEQFDKQPVSTDQFIKYLKAVELSDKHIGKLIKFIIDEKRALYSWQNYLLWQLFVLKDVNSEVLIKHAFSVLNSEQSCEADKSGAALYIGKVTDDEDKKKLLPKFEGCGSYLQQRNILIGIHEIRFSKEVLGYLSPHMPDELEGVYRGLKKKKYKGIYCKRPDPVSYKRIYDEVCQYEYV